MKKIIMLLLAAILILAGCSSEDTTSGSISAGGSTSVQPLFETYITAYQAEYPGVTITYEGKGSSDGITNTLNGTYAFGASSRELKPEEQVEGLEENVLAIDGISVVVHPDNPVQDLTIEQINQIYTGEITNWSEVGGNDAEISVVSRDSASGTRGAFEEIIGFGGEGGTPLTQSAVQVDSNGAVAQTVAGNPNAIGYVSFEAVDETIKPLSVDGVEATKENVSNGTYPVSRPYILIYFPEELNETEQAFLDWVNVNKAELAEEAGLIAPTM